MTRISLSLLCLLVFTFTSSSSAQLVNGFGFKVGLTMANQNFDYAPHLGDLTLDTKCRQGFNGGVFVDFLRVPFLSVCTEVNYTQKGMKYEIQVTTDQSPQGTGEIMTSDFRLDYLNLRVLGKLRYNRSLLSPFLLFGPRFEYKIGDKMDQGLELVYDDFKKELYGISVGLGVELSTLLSRPILAEFVYNHDLSTPYKSENLEVKNKDFELRLGIEF